MTLTRRFFLLAGLLAPWASFGQEPPVVVEGQRFDRRAQVGGAELLLNGTGVRAVAWFKGYAAGLYLLARATRAEQALAMPGPKRLQMRMLQDVPAAEFVKAIRKGVERNSPTQDLARLAPSLALFQAQIAAAGKVRKGDVIDLDLDTALGLRFSLNGTLRGEPIAGPDFYTAVLRAFVGDHPYDARLKSGLLGQVG
jgi:hypothetical protein